MSAKTLLQVCQAVSLMYLQIDAEEFKALCNREMIEFETLEDIDDVERSKRNAP